MTYVRFSEILKDYLEANNISNKEFATRIGITPKHLIDILAGKIELSASVIQSISIVTGISSDYIITMEDNYRMAQNIQKFLNDNETSLVQYLNKFLYKELIKDGWVNFIHVDDKLTVLMDILKYLRVADPNNLYKIDKNILYKSKNDKPELLMIWLERCFRIANEQDVKEYKKENLDILVNFIIEEAKKSIFDEKKLIKVFNENGIQLVIENDLPGSKIRGAFKVNKDTPAIYLTRKYKRLADIYFALLHELAHCKSDFNKAKSTNLVTYDEDKCESEADIQALDWMVDKEYYTSIIKSDNFDFIDKKKYPVSFILYRLAKDKYIDYSTELYQKYNPVIKFDNDNK